MSYFNPNAALSLKRPEALLFDWDNTLVDSRGAIHLERLTALPAAGELLETVRETGVYTALVSNKSGSYLRQELAHIGWEKYFNTAIGAGDAASDKPSAEPVSLVLAGSGIAASPSVWFIGDSQVDIDTARRAVHRRADRPGSNRQRRAGGAD